MMKVQACTFFTLNFVVFAKKINKYLWILWISSSVAAPTSSRIETSPNNVHPWNVSKNVWKIGKSSKFERKKESFEIGDEESPQIRSSRFDAFVSLFRFRGGIQKACLKLKEHATFCVWKNSWIFSNFFWHYRYIQKWPTPLNFYIFSFFSVHSFQNSVKRKWKLNCAISAMPEFFDFRHHRWKPSKKSIMYVSLFH